MVKQEIYNKPVKNKTSNSVKQTYYYKGGDFGGRQRR